MRRVTTIIMMIAFFAGCAEALAAEITLRDSATVGRGYVRMADIATMSGFDAATTQKINGIFCGSSPIARRDPHHRPGLHQDAPAAARHRPGGR